MSKTDEFVKKWCMKSVECMKGDDYIMYDEDECRADFRAAVESLFPSDEVIEDCAQESFDMEDPNAPICEIDYLGGFVEGAKWLRSRLLAAIDAKDDAKDLQDKK